MTTTTQPSPSKPTNSPAIAAPSQARRPMPSKSDASRQEVKVCEKCRKPVADFAACPHCGYYAQLGQYVEIDCEMEGHGEMRPPERFKLPRWAYLLIAVNVALLVESIAAAIFLPIDSVERLALSVAHLGIGILCMLLAHAKASLLAMMDDIDTTIVDCIASPPKIWESVVSRLPDSHAVITTFLSGGFAVLMSLAILRTIPYSQLWESDAPMPRYESLLSKVVRNMPVQQTQSSSQLDMDDALSEFAAQAADLENMDTKDLDAEMLKQILGEEMASLIGEEDPEPIIEDVKGVVIGFTVLEQAPDTLASIIVATGNRDKSKNVRFEVLGRISTLDQPYAADLLKFLKTTVQPDPFVDTELQATWVRPQVRCEVRYEKVEDGPPSNLQILRTY